jgi:hypothetical protein
VPSTQFVDVAIATASLAKAAVSIQPTGDPGGPSWVIDLAAIGQQGSHMGELATELLLDEIRDADHQHQEVVLELYLIARAAASPRPRVSPTPGPRPTRRRPAG